MIRPEMPNDIESIREVNCSAFATLAEADLVDRLRTNDKLSVSLVALSNHKVVGHIGFSPLTINDQPTRGLGLAPLAVAPTHQRQGVGQELIQRGIDACRSAKATFLVVLGEPGYYGRFGFQRASDFGLRDAYGGGDAFMAVELTNGSLNHWHGLVQYSSEFDQL